MAVHKDRSEPIKTTIMEAKSNHVPDGLNVLKFEDNRPEATAQKQLQGLANNSPQANHVSQLQAMANNYSAPQQPLQKKENKTGLPDQLKTGIENLSGYAMDDVKVHRNSDKPAQLNAHAYAQGTDIHLASGQEKHLPHEAWHVVQQKQGRVKPTLQMKGKVNINDDAGLEKEADMMGAKALSLTETASAKEEVQNMGGMTVQQFSKVVQREEESGAENNAKLQEIVVTLEKIIASGDANVDGDAPKELANYITDLKTIIKEGDAETKRIALDGLYKEAGKQLGAAPKDVPAKIPGKGTAQLKQEVAQRELGTLAVVGIALLAVGGVALIGFGIYKLVKHISARRAQQYGPVEDQDMDEMQDVPVVVLPGGPSSTSGTIGTDGYRRTWTVGTMQYFFSSGHGYRVNHHKPSETPSKDITQLGTMDEVELAILRHITGVGGIPAVGESGERAITVGGQAVEYRFKRFAPTKMGIGTYYRPD